MAREAHALDRRLFVLSRPAGMFWMSCQIFQFCASRLAGATAPVRRAGRLAGQDAHAYCGCLDHQAAADPARRRPGGQSRGLLRGRSPRAAGDPTAGRLGLGNQCDTNGVVPDDAALRQWHPVAAARHETAMESLRGSSRQQAGALPGGDGCSGGQCAGIMPDLVHVGLGRVWGGALPRLAGDWPAVDWQPGVCVLEVAVEHDG